MTGDLCDIFVPIAHVVQMSAAVKCVKEFQTSLNARVCHGQACSLKKCFGSGKFWSGCDDGCVAGCLETANIALPAAGPGPAAFRLCWAK